MTTTEQPSPATARKSRRLIQLILAALALALLAYLGVGAFVAGKVTEIDKDHPKGTKTPATFGLDYQTVRFPARGEDLQIAAWYIPSAGSQRAMVLVHGRDASKQDAISGNFVDFGAALNAAGISVLMIDLRGHGESEGERYSFGVFERRDVLGAVDWLQGQGFQPGRIGVLGISLGGASVIGAAAEDTAIGLLVLESTFADLGPLIEKNFEEEAGLPKLFLLGVYWMNRVLYGYDVGNIRPVDEAAGMTPRPVLIVHCTADEDVDFSHAESLKAAMPYAETWFVEGCEHAEIYRDLPEEYEEHVISFIADNLP